MKRFIEDQNRFQLTLFLDSFDNDTGYLLTVFISERFNHLADKIHRVVGLI